MSDLEPDSVTPPVDAITPTDAAVPSDARLADEEMPKRRRRLGTVLVVLLSVALVAALAGLGIVLVQLDKANKTIGDQNEQIDKQRQLIDKKDTFSAAMQSLIATASGLDGVRFAALVPLTRYQALAVQAWDHRDDLVALNSDIRAADSERKALEGVQAAAADQASTNGSGTVYEATIDQLGGGYVASSIDNASQICQKVALACVVDSDPYTVHFDAASLSEPYMTDFIQTGIAYHEYAHSLQFTNPVQTETAVAAFGGDVETMADCFALTYVDGWSLHQEVFVSRYYYYEVDLGYGYTCNDDQRAGIRTWYDSLPLTVGEISQ